MSFLVGIENCDIPNTGCIDMPLSCAKNKQRRKFENNKIIELRCCEFPTHGLRRFISVAGSGFSALSFEDTDVALPSLNLSVKCSQIPFR
jgi:hypothetical protein